MSAGALDLLNGLELEDGRRWGDAAAPFQVADAEAVLSRSGPRRHFQTRPRGGSKTTDEGGVATAALVEQLAPMSRSYAAAADAGQAALLVDAIAGFVVRSGLGGVLRVDNLKVTNTRNGATLEVLAADEASSWGIKPDFLVIDEFAAWKSTPGPRRFWQSLFSAMVKVPGSRLVILTTAGDPAHFSAGVLKRAKEQPDRWRVSEVPGPVPWVSAADLAEQRAELPDWDFRRLHLNEWVEPEDRLTTGDDLAACVTLDGPRTAVLGRRYALGLDVGLKNDRTVLTICSVDGRTPVVALDRILVWQGTRQKPVSLEAVEAAVLEAWRAYRHPPLVADPWQSAQLAQRLRARNVRVIEYAFTSTSVSRLALRLHGLIRDHALELPDDPELLEELRNVRLRETSPGVYRLDHDPGNHDDRAIALALAAEHLLARRLGGGGQMFVPVGRIPGVGPRDGLARANLLPHVRTHDSTAARAELNRLKRGAR